MMYLSQVRVTESALIKDFNNRPETFFSPIRIIPTKRSFRNYFFVVPAFLCLFNKQRSTMNADLQLIAGLVQADGRPFCR